MGNSLGMRKLGQNREEQDERIEVYVVILIMPSSAGYAGYGRTHCKDLYNFPPQSLNRAAACSGVISRCGSAINSYPTKNFRTVALRRRGG